MGREIATDEHGVQFRIDNTPKLSNLAESKFLENSIYNLFSFSFLVAVIIVIVIIIIFIVVVMPVLESPPVIVARFLRANNYNDVRKSVESPS